MEAGEQDGEGVDEAAGRVLGERTREERSVGQGEVEVRGHERSRRLLPVGGAPSRDVGPGFDGGDVEVLEHAEDVELPRACRSSVSLIASGSSPFSMNRTMWREMPRGVRP